MFLILGWFDWFSTLTVIKICVNVKGRNLNIENFYEGIVRIDFNALCDQNLGAEDYLKIIKNCKFIAIENVPQFNDTNSNQQKRFITLLDVIYDKGIPLAITAKQNLDEFTSSSLLETPFKRTISRLYELTSIETSLWYKNFIIFKLIQMDKNCMNLLIKL